MTDISLKPFNQIISETNARVVISSSWRTLIGPEDDYQTQEDFFEFLRAEGLVAECVGVTPVLRGVTRGAEIQAWLAQAEDVEDYLIFEDNVDDEMPVEHLIETIPEVGLTWELAESSILRLQSGSFRFEGDRS